MIAYKSKFLSSVNFFLRKLSIELQSNILSFLKSNRASNPCFYFSFRLIHNPCTADLPWTGTRPSWGCKSQTERRHSTGRAGLPSSGRIPISFLWFLGGRSIPRRICSWWPYSGRGWVHRPYPECRAWFGNCGTAIVVEVSVCLFYAATVRPKW